MIQLANQRNIHILTTDDRFTTIFMRPTRLYDDDINGYGPVV